MKFYKISKDVHDKLVGKHEAYVYLVYGVIACRASFTGSAYLGDYQKIGINRYQYRKALSILEEEGLIKKFSSRQGTTILLIN